MTPQENELDKIAHEIWHVEYYEPDKWREALLKLQREAWLVGYTEGNNHVQGYGPHRKPNET